MYQPTNSQSLLPSIQEEAVPHQREKNLPQPRCNPLVRRLATSSSSANKKELREKEEKGVCHSKTRMSNENSTSSPGITSSYLYKVFYQAVGKVIKVNKKVGCVLLLETRVIGTN